MTHGLQFKPESLSELKTHQARVFDMRHLAAGLFLQFNKELQQKIRASLSQLAFTARGLSPTLQILLKTHSLVIPDRAWVSFLNRV